MSSFYRKIDFTFLLQLITFEPLELKQSYIPHLKVLMCGINSQSHQWRGCIFILCYTHLKLELLLHKIIFVTFLLASTVSEGSCREANKVLCLCCSKNTREPSVCVRFSDLYRDGCSAAKEAGMSLEPVQRVQLLPSISSNGC